MDSAMQLHVGIDDTDSLAGGCTTYLSSLIIEALLRDFGVRFIDYPLLVRLNPNIPWKTRGNGAVCLRLLVARDRVDELKERVVKMVVAHSEMDAVDTDPAVVFSHEVGDGFSAFYDNALKKVIGIEDALRFADDNGCDVRAYKSKRGIVGCLAAIGSALEGDHTFELISYRDRSHWGRPRPIDPKSVIEMDAKARGTFNNIDPETGRVLIAPHGHDPVLVGIRGEDAPSILEAFNSLKILEPVVRWTIFRSNQGTDVHLPTSPAPISSVKPHESVCAEGAVTAPPRAIRGGHLILALGDSTGEIECAAYEPTGSFRNTVSKLIRADRVRVFGGVRPLEDGRLTLNVEKLQVLELDDAIASRPPICPRCGIRCKSSGLRQGYRCRRCGRWQQRREALPSRRAISVGTFVPPPRANRHLTKPLGRYGLEKAQYSVTVPAEPWHWP